MRGLENYTIDDGVSLGGIHRKIHIQGDQVITQETIDMQPYLEHAAKMRELNAGLPWGEGKTIGTIDGVSHKKIMLIKDPKEREKAILEYFRERPLLVHYDGYYKTLAM